MRAEERNEVSFTSRTHFPFNLPLIKSRDNPEIYSKGRMKTPKRLERGRNAECLDKYFYSIIKFSFQQISTIICSRVRKLYPRGFPLIKSTLSHNLKRKFAEVSHRMKIRLFVIARVFLVELSYLNQAFKL